MRTALAINICLILEKSTETGFERYHLAWCKLGRSEWSKQEKVSDRPAVWKIPAEKSESEKVKKRTNGFPVLISFPLRDSSESYRTTEVGFNPGGGFRRVPPNPKLDHSSS
jgi:hypothetical protein